MTGSNLMKPNVGLADRYIRIAVGGLMLAATAGQMARRPGISSVTLGLLGGMTLAEGILGTCPVYSLTGIDTRGLGAHDEPFTNDTIMPYEGI